MDRQEYESQLNGTGEQSEDYCPECGFKDCRCCDWPDDVEDESLADAKNVDSPARRAAADSKMLVDAILAGFISDDSRTAGSGL